MGGLDDLGKLVGTGYDKVRDGVDWGKEKLGQGIDAATDKIGEGLEYVGAEGVADKVEDWGDRTASSLGAEVGEQQLGETEDADELVHGNPSKITAAVKNLRDFRDAFDSVGRGMKGLDSSHWKGEAADAFREKFAPHPGEWMKAADAFDDAAGALDSYASTVRWAQGKAKEAIALYKKGQQASKTAVDAYNEKVDAYNAARSGPDPLPRPAPFTDPGTEQRERAHEILKEARRQRNEAGDRAKSAVRAALAHAPKEPTGLERAKFDLADYSVAQGVEMMHLGGGIVKGTAGLINFVRSVNPIDGYNLTHPAEYYKSVNMTLAGLASTAANPDRALKNAWEAAKGDPSEFLGRLVPELIGTKGAGSIRTLARTGARNGLKEGVESAARKGVGDDPAKPSRQSHAMENGPSDPIDLATGAMYLPQTDITLPGTLPLTFRRRVASDYRAGRWFGPSWSSTADQRLEIDSQGIVFVCEDGLLLSYAHPAPGVPVLPSHGPRWPLDRDPDGDYTVTDPDTGRVWHFTPALFPYVSPTVTPNGAELALLTQVDDRNGNWITYEYDPETSAPTSIVHSGGYRLNLTAHDGRITALHLAGAAPEGGDQEILRYGYADGCLTEVVNSSGLPLRFTYDDRARVTSWTDTNGSRYDYAYDDRDRCIAEGGVAGHVALRLDYDGTDPGTGLRVTTATTGSGAVHRYLVNDAHQIVAETDPLGAVTRFERDRYNRLLSRTDPLGHTTRFAYDEAGRLTRVVRPDGREATAEYNALGLPVRVTGPDRNSVRQEYDERGNRVAATAPSGATTRYAYDEAGRLTAVVDPLGHTTRIRNDAAGLPVEITDPLGAVTRFERDAFGRPMTVTDPLGAVTRLQWTTEGRLARRVEADGSEQSWTYDGEGNCTSHTDAMGGVSRFEYTHFDLLTARTGPDGVRYEFTHDTDLRLIGVTNPQGLTWAYEYDAAGRLISETDFDDRTLAYEHDAAGRLTERINGLGQSIRFEHNSLGQVVRKDADGAVTTFAYDLSDQLAEAAGPDATIAYVRDRYGRLKYETVGGRTVAYGHDELGRRTSRTTPSGAVSTWTYDAAGRRASLTTSGHELSFERDAAGREVARRVDETVTLASAFDDVGRLTGHTVTGRGRTLQRRSYAYQADGHLVGIDDLLGGARRFDLDAAGRVTAVHADGWTETYAYDEAGNQTQAAWPADHPGQEAAGPRTYTGTRITRAGNVRYEHDALGRITLRQKTRLSRKPDTWRYEWDAEDRLTAVTTPDGTRWRYRYDPLGRRTAKQRLAADGETILEQVAFVWDGTTLCEETTTSAALPNPVTLTWDHDGLRPIAQTERITAADAPQQEIDRRFFTIVTDLVGAPTELIDEAGTIAWRTRSTLWGTTAWTADATAHTPLRFPGQYFDPETGLHYNYFRHYDPETARFLTPDPLGLTPAPNPATYVHNPHTWTDPLGLAPCRGSMDYMGADNAIPAGDPVTHGPTGTLIGSDGKSVRNFNNVLNVGEHDVVAHGSRGGFLEMSEGYVNGGQIVDAVTNNPNYNGGPLRLMVCHSGADSSGIAQQIANELGVTVRAPTDMVGTNRRLGAGQTPQIANDGYWRVFLPIIGG
ncbi:putative T7SS-secreted protein [Streptomyces sp. CC210A]|uniref:putative T7SS-secreted protein n=1 Tax=Streptomyces sp. CC210A TaxID=2898184 RepID=UPI001F1BAF87|nr:RHS repeat-associated core domain-containing protein [Streptomyces sp. CC210A]